VLGSYHFCPKWYLTTIFGADSWQRALVVNLDDLNPFYERWGPLSGPTYQNTKDLCRVKDFDTMDRESPF
jgi:hypothetical protein